jgi:hypothetical protein
VRGKGRIAKSRPAIPRQGRSRSAHRRRSRAAGIQLEGRQRGARTEQAPREGGRNSGGLDFRRSNCYTSITMRRTLPTAVVMAVLAAALSAPAQLLMPDVTVDVQPLPEEARAKLVGLDSILTKYLEDQQWAGDDYKYDFPIQIGIYFTEYSPDPQEDKFKAKLIASNKKDVRFEDTRWEFGLRQPVQFRPQEYHPFKSVIEFYVWMLIGTEYDKLEKLGGQPYYDRARGIYLQSSSSIYYFGWDRRNDLLRAQVDESNRLVRELNFFYYTGIYFDEQRDYRNAKNYLYYALVKLDKVPVDVQGRFLEVNHRQFAEALVRAGYLQGVRALIQLDPQRRSIYESIAPEGGNNK